MKRLQYLKYLKVKTRNLRPLKNREYDNHIISKTSKKLKIVFLNELMDLLVMIVEFLHFLILLLEEKVLNR